MKGGKAKKPVNTTSTTPVEPDQQWKTYIKLPPNYAAMRTAKVFFPLSLYMIYHTGKSFASIVDFVLKKSGLTPANVEFILGDSPQANNYAINEPDADPDGKELRDRADHAGDTWVSENHDAVMRLLDAGVKFTRWRTVYEDPEYQELKGKVVALYNDDSPQGIQLKGAVKDTAFQVLDRFQERGAINDRARGEEMAIRFVLEECALFAHKALKDRYHYMAYPSPCPAAVSAVKSIFVDPHALAKNLLQWLKIGIKHPRPTQQSEAPAPEAGSGSKADKDSGFNEPSPHGSESGSSSPEMSSGGSGDEGEKLTDEAKEARTAIKKLFKGVILATAAGLEGTGQLPRVDRGKMLTEVLEELRDEIAQTENLSKSPRPSPPSQRKSNADSPALPVVE